MFKVNVFDLKDKETNVLDIRLSDGYDISDERYDLLYYYIQNAEYANNRQGTAHVKRRGDVSGGGKKPWKQKGTGRARQGSIRAPQWTGGGVVFGPNGREYHCKVNQKMWRKFLLCSLYRVIRDNRLFVLKENNLIPNTKLAIECINNMQCNQKVVLFSDCDNIVKSFRNISTVDCRKKFNFKVVDFKRSCSFVFSSNFLKQLLISHKVGDIQ